MSDRQYPQEKVKNIVEFEDLINGSNSIFLADFSGLDVKKMNTLRDKFHQNSVEIRVIKNTLAKIALHNAGIQDLDSFLNGQNAFAFGHDDPAAPARILFDFAKEYDTPKIRGGIFEGRLIGPDKINVIRNLPSKEQILAQIVSQIQAPVSTFIGVLNEILRSFVGVIDAVIEKKSGKVDAS